jgi:hypothetical protein
VPGFQDLVRESANRLIGGVVSADRFRKWRANLDHGVASTLNRYAFGEIFWRKGLGRPNTVHLSDGFVIDAWHEQMVLVGSIGGPAHWQPLRVPYTPSWWDGKDDDEHWRVTYMIPDLLRGETADGLTEHFEHTHIAPRLKREVPWTIPGGRFGIGHAGLRTLAPPAVVFVKKEASAHFSFEVVLGSLFVSP